MQPLLFRKVPAHDGIHLATDVYLPDGRGAYPVVLVRTPYHRTRYQQYGHIFSDRGFAFVIQDVRGKYDSDGQFHPLLDEASDGQVTLEWVADQRWCNGRIALWGPSYHGIVQVPAAAGGHEALRAISPSVAPASFFRDWVSYDGCFALANMIQFLLKHASTPTEPPQEHFKWDELYRLGSLDAIAQRVGFETPILREWASRDRYDEYWRSIDQELMHEKIRVPGYHAGGWFDHITRGQFSAYQGIRDRGATVEARAGQRLLIGPWGHANFLPGPDRRRYGDWDFGPEADLVVLTQELQFFDYHLKDIDTGFADQPPVKVFLMGKNEWIGLRDWPPPRHTVQHWYLNSEGSANMRTGDGNLTLELPETSYADVFRSDPTDPVPTLGGPVYWGLEHLGPLDQNPILDRPDVLYYRSPKLIRPLLVIGDIDIELWVSSDAEDTDFVAKLCVEEPSGAITCLTFGSLRCRYRDSWGDPKPLTPGEPVLIRLQMGQTAYEFPGGARIGLIVTGSDFPRILPNPNSIASPWEPVDPVVATNQLLHGPGTASRLSLPIAEQ